MCIKLYTFILTVTGLQTQTHIRRINILINKLPFLKSKVKLNFIVIDKSGHYKNK